MACCRCNGRLVDDNNVTACWLCKGSNDETIDHNINIGIEEFAYEWWINTGRRYWSSFCSTGMSAFDCARLTHCFKCITSIIDIYKNHTCREIYTPEPEYKKPGLMQRIKNFFSCLFGKRKK